MTSEPKLHMLLEKYDLGGIKTIGVLRKKNKYI